ncbi:WD repeat-containing protein 97 isoform X2 [Diachasma alloeum]|uniref:WD repeat-containing protein 97 isoform X2 n=1 Tax=Diachasma alloeum TaxID=454923 RepID=UPI0007384CA7|nr:WD repeat-containing protein 97 isoform X2 [Diachasma alloeum]
MIPKFSIQGKPVQPSFSLSSTMAFTKFLWFQASKMFAGFIPHDDLIWILEPTCKLIQIVRNEFRVENVFYTPYTNEMLVIGATRATRFPLDHKEQTLNSWKTVNISDSSFGPTWVLEYSSLIQHDPLFLRLAGSYLTTVYVIPLASDKDEDSNVPVKFLARKVNAMETAITVLYFHSTSRWIITGDQRGSVSAWNLDLECMMDCPSGHQGAVKIITGHPSICGFISCGEDDIVQAWSCNLKQKIESFNELGEVSYMAVNGSASSLATVGAKLSCFQMHQLYTFYSPLTAEPAKLFATASPIDTTRVVVCCADKIVRMLSSASGQQLNIQILPTHSAVLAVAHSAIAGRMYILGTNGILVANTKTNPMKIEDEWESAEKIITCLVVYDHYEAIRGSDREAEKSKLVNAICTRIIIGTEKGELISIEETSGKQESSISAHDAGIIHLHSSIVSRQVISSSADKSLKIWRIFPDTLMPLSLLHCIYYTTPITCIGSLGSTICVVSSTESSQCHQLFMYDVVERRQLEHHPSKNHVKQILALATSESLQICATSSMDGSLRIWDHQNDLVKILEINVCTSHITFSALLGDIVFSAGKHLYRIPYENYLSPKYRLQILNNGIEKEEEEMLDDPESKSIDEHLVIDDKMLHPVSSVPLGSLDPSTDAPSLDLMFKEQMCAQLRYRDEDILRIKENILNAKKIVKMKTMMEHHDWERHIAELLGISSRTENGTSPHDIWNYVEKYGKNRKVFNKSEQPHMIGCSIKQFSDELKLPAEIYEPGLNLHAFLPNSLVIKVADTEDMKADDFNETEQLERHRLKYNYPSEIYLTMGPSASEGFSDEAIETVQ